MSIWTKINCDVLKKNVNKKIFSEALKEMDITLDEKVKHLENYYGESNCDAMILNKGIKTTLGIKYTREKGIELVGDMWDTGFDKYKTEEKLLDAMAYNYQIYNIKDKLLYSQQSNWCLEREYNQNGKKVLELIQY